MPNNVEASGPAEFTRDSAPQSSSNYAAEVMTSTSTNKDWFAINAKARENKQHLPQLTVDDFLNNSERVLTKIDVNQDGWVGASEISQAVDNPYIRGKDAQIVSAFHELQTTSKEFHPFGGYTNSLQMHQIDGAKERLETLMIAASINNKAPDKNELIFPILDRNGDDVLDRAELSEAMKDPNTASGSLAVAMRMFHKKDVQAFDKGKPYEGLTPDDIDNLNRVMGDTNFYVKGVVNNSLKTTAEAQRSIRTTEAFKDTDDPLNSIWSDSINQGGVGNCYFHSVLASIADKRPELIRDMIEDQGNGNFKVTFPGDKEHPMFVSVPSDINVTKFNRPNQNGMWPNILEKAFGKYEAIKRDVPLDSVPNALGSDEGGDSANAIKLLTGNNAYSADVTGLFDLTKYKPEVFDRQTENFKDWLDEGNIITAGTGNADPENNPFNLQSMHAISVMSHYEQDGKTYFVLRDPWGNHSPIKDNKNGVFTLEAKDFLASFPVFAVESS